MKLPIKYLFIAFILLLSNFLSAQTFGVRAGINLPRVAVQFGGKDQSDNLETKIGFHVGLSLQVPISPIFSLETGLLLSTKGYKETEDDSPDFQYTENFNPYYLEVPILLRGSFDIGGPRLIFQAGPYIAMGIGGSIRQEYTELGQTDTETHDVKWGSENGNVSLFDFGLNIGAGLEFNKFQVILSYGLGLSNLGNYGSNSDNYIKNRVLGLSLGYNFNNTNME